jgi:hypothetical protein
VPCRTGLPNTRVRFPLLGLAKSWSEGCRHIQGPEFGYLLLTQSILGCTTQFLVGHDLCQTGKSWQEKLNTAKLFPGSLQRMSKQILCSKILYSKTPFSAAKLFLSRLMPPNPKPPLSIEGINTLHYEYAKWPGSRGFPNFLEPSHPLQNTRQPLPSGESCLKTMINAHSPTYHSRHPSSSCASRRSYHSRHRRRKAS